MTKLKNTVKTYKAKLPMCSLRGERMNDDFYYGHIIELFKKGRGSNYEMKRELFLIDNEGFHSSSVEFDESTLIEVNLGTVENHGWAMIVDMDLPTDDMRNAIERGKLIFPKGVSQS